jgi:hypothetical protein
VEQQFTAEAQAAIPLAQSTKKQRSEETKGQEADGSLQPDAKD